MCSPQLGLYVVKNDAKHLMQSARLRFTLGDEDFYIWGHFAGRQSPDKANKPDSGSAAVNRLLVERAGDMWTAPVAQACVVAQQGPHAAGRFPFLCSPGQLVSVC